MSLPSSSRSADEMASRRRRDSHDQKPSSSEPTVALSNAAQALERIELPAEVSARISELVWTGGSLIITDQPLSDETSDTGTDLVVTLR
jgi:hypothetical protein